MATQNAVPLSPAELEQIRTDLANLLRDHICGNLVSAVFNQLSTNTGKKAFSADAMKIFEAVEKQGGFGRRTLGATAEGGSTVGNGNAFININFFVSPEPMISASNGRVILHELFHVGSSTGSDYSHFEMASAAFDVAQAQGFTGLGVRPSGEDPQGHDRVNSEIFNSILFRACHVR